MLSRCFNIIEKQAKILNKRTGKGSEKIQIKNGNKIAEIKEPKDMMCQINMTMIKKISVMLADNGDKAKKTPALVRTPLPPLKPKKTLQLWPAIAAQPTPVLIQELTG